MKKFDEFINEMKTIEYKGDEIEYDSGPREFVISTEQANLSIENNGMIELDLYGTTQEIVRFYLPKNVFSELKKFFKSI